MVFQSHNLFPHLTVLQNVTRGPLLVAGRPRERPREGLALLERVGLAEKADAAPVRSCPVGSSSGSGIARALAGRPARRAVRRRSTHSDAEPPGQRQA